MAAYGIGDNATVTDDGAGIGAKQLAGPGQSLLS